MPTESTQQDVYFGEGAFKTVASILNDLSAKVIFLVSDEPAYEASGASEKLEPILTGRKIERFVGFEPNPKLEDVQRGILQFRQAKPDVVIAVGGGTAIDLAKLIGTLAVHQTDANDLIRGTDTIEQSGPPLIVIPTTAGTGSEATHFAVAYIDGKKYSLADSRILPTYVVFDPRLTHSVPASITAATGLDAFCQAVESIWAVGATDESIAYASDAVELALEHLPTCVLNPTPESRAAMCRAAHLSGKAINISKTTAPHAISYAITTRFGVPHGMAVALTLGSLLQFNAAVSDADCLDSRGADYVKKSVAQIVNFLGAASSTEAAQRISALVSSIHSPLSLQDAGVDTREIGWIADQVNVERLSNNPRKITKRDIEDILTAIS